MGILDSLVITRSFTEIGLTFIVNDNGMFPPNISRCDRSMVSGKEEAITVESLFADKVLSCPLDSRVAPISVEKACRAIIRSVISIMVGILISPVGTMYHMTMLAGFSVKHQYQHSIVKNPELASQTLQKINIHCKCFFKDLQLSLIGWSNIGFGASWKTGILFSTSLAKKMIFVIPAFDLSFGLMMQRVLPHFIVNKNNRLATYIAIELKNRYGFQSFGDSIFNLVGDSDDMTGVPELRAIEEQCYMAELSFLDTVREINRYLQEKKLEAININENKDDLFSSEKLIRQLRRRLVAGPFRTLPVDELKRIHIREHESLKEEQDEQLRQLLEELEGQRESIVREHLGAHDELTIRQNSELESLHLNIFENKLQKARLQVVEHNDFHKKVEEFLHTDFYGLIAKIYKRIYKPQALELFTKRTYMFERKAAEEYITSKFACGDSTWNEFVLSSKPNVRPLLMKNTKYLEFRERLFAQRGDVVDETVTIAHLLGLSEDLSQEKLDEAYRKYAYRLGPLSNDHSQEGEFLFTCLTEARNRLQTRFLR
jgi:hypothetical protein